MMILPRVDTWDTDDDRVSNLGLMLLLTLLLLQPALLPLLLQPALLHMASSGLVELAYPCGSLRAVIHAVLDI